MGAAGGDIAAHVIPVPLFIGRRDDDAQIFSQGLLPGVTEDLFCPQVVTYDQVIFIDGDNGVGAAEEDAGVDLVLLPEFLKLTEHSFQKRGAGTGDEAGEPFPGRTRQVTNPLLPIQDQVKGLRLKFGKRPEGLFALIGKETQGNRLGLDLRQDPGRRRTRGRRAAGLKKLYFDEGIAHRRVRQEQGKATGFFPVDDDGDADELGRIGHAYCPATLKGREDLAALQLSLNKKIL
jgi:hypothetical protein